MQRQLVGLFAFSIAACVFCKSSFAQTFSGGFNSSRVVQLRWYSSLPASYISTYITPAVGGWNGISSVVSLSQVSSGAYDISFTTSTSAQTGLYGETVPYCTSGGQQLQSNACVPVLNWGSAKIVGYTNQIANDKLTETQIVSSVYCHEFGHALSLGHTNNTTSSVSVMKQGIILSYLPQAFDKSLLKTRWGN
jgi:hypothetical protein